MPYKDPGPADWIIPTVREEARERSRHGIALVVECRPELAADWIREPKHDPSFPEAESIGRGEIAVEPFGVGPSSYQHGPAGVAPPLELGPFGEKRALATVGEVPEPPATPRLHEAVFTDRVPGLCRDDAVLVGAHIEIDPTLGRNNDVA